MTKKSNSQKRTYNARKFLDGTYYPLGQISCVVGLTAVVNLRSYRQGRNEHHRHRRFQHRLTNTFLTLKHSNMDTKTSPAHVVVATLIVVTILTISLHFSMLITA